MNNGPYIDAGMMQLDQATPDILALGDSWFWWHVNNLLIPIWNLYNIPKVILTQGGAGAEARELAKGGNLTAFKTTLKGSPTLKAVLLSAGGNDFAGRKHMSRILRPDCSNAATGEDCFKPDEIHELLSVEVLDAYRTLVGSVTEHRPEAHVYVHNYDYAIPTGIGILGFGHWLKDPMDRVGVPGPVQPLAVNYLINTFSDMLVQLQSEFPDHVVFIDSTNVLSAGDWANELHPKAGGFDKLVDKAWAPELANLP